MAVSETFVVLVHNVQQHLAARVEILLDELSTHHESFELILIDDGSTDDTLSIARELSRRFPQVRVVQRDARYGFDSSVQLALRVASGRHVSIVTFDPGTSRIKLRRIELAVASAATNPHYRQLAFARFRSVGAHGPAPRSRPSVPRN